MTMPAATQKKSVWVWLGLVLAVAILERVALWFFYQPGVYSDSHSYRRLAAGILDHWAYDGTRTPGYPIFLILVGSDERVWLAQMALGIGITLLLFYLGWSLSRNPAFAGLVALAHTLNLGQVFFEANILTETLTTFWLVLAFSGFAMVIFQPKMRQTWLAFFVGLATALAIMVRPLFIYLPVWLLACLVWVGSPQRFRLQGSLWAWPGDLIRFILSSLRRTWLSVAAFLLPVILIVGAWMNYIHNTYGDWALSTMTGYHLMQHTGVFFEYAPDEYASLRDTYLKYRQARIAEVGSQTNTIWYAIPEMQEVSGLNFFSLSRTLARISLQLIWEHPGLYLRNVIKGWWLFWLAPVYWQPESVRWESLAYLLDGLIWMQRLALVAFNLFFVVSSVMVMMISKLRSKLAVSPVLWSLAGMIWLASFVQTLLDHGDNPRFLIPLQSLVVLWGMWLAWRGRRIWRFVVLLRFLLPFLGIAGLLAVLDRLGSGLQTAPLLATWLPGFMAYAILLLAGVAGVNAFEKLVHADKMARRAAWTAFWLRLGIGIALALLLPVMGYQDNECSLQGYVFQDACVRDQAALALARSETPLIQAFTGEYKGDQYGGLLALSAGLYRYLSPGGHRPFLLLILSAVFGALGVLALWRVALDWFGVPPQKNDRHLVACLAAWIFALYPEGVLLGSSQMREAFLIPGLALLLWAYSRLRRLPWLCRGQWRGWVGFLLLTIFLFSFQPPTTLAFLVVLAGLWLFEPGGRLSWRQALLVVVGLTAALLLVIGILSSLPSLVELSWGRVLFTWLQNNFGYQSHVIERQSGMVQKLLVSLPQALRLPVILAYGAVQPVLPAVLVDPAAWIWRLIGILRSLGWYLLAPILVYGLLATFRGGEQPRHGQRLWLNLVVFSWILLAAANGGGDQWDNPRYRAVFLVFQALLAAWALSWARNGRPELRRTDPWLWRWLGATGLFVLLFLEWYLGRQYPDWLHIDLTVMILVTLGVGGGFLLASWLWDWVRTRRRPGNHT